MYVVYLVNYEILCKLTMCFSQCLMLKSGSSVTTLAHYSGPIIGPQSQETKIWQGIRNKEM